MQGSARRGLKAKGLSFRAGVGAKAWVRCRELGYADASLNVSILGFPPGPPFSGTLPRVWRLGMLWKGMLWKARLEPGSLNSSLEAYKLEPGSLNSSLEA